MQPPKPAQSDDDSSSQLTLFDLGVDMKHLRARRDELLQGVESINTRKAYEQAWKQFDAWCKNAGRLALPASTETISLHLTSLIDSGKRISTAELRLSGIAWMHRRSGFPSPVVPQLRSVLTGARCSLKEAPGGKSAMTVEELRLISEALNDGSLLGVRDRALIVLGFATGLRRSELSALNMSDIKFVPQGVAVQVRHSKTDQKAVGRTIGIFPGKRASTCPVRLLKAWLKVRGSAPGGLFLASLCDGSAFTERRILGNTVLQVVKRAVVRADLDPAKFGAHSLRSGCVTAGVNGGAGELQIMQRTGHKSIQTLKRYFRPASAFSSNPLAKAL